MKTITMMAVAAAIAFSAASFRPRPLQRQRRDRHLRDITAWHTKLERTAALQASSNVRQRPPASVATAYIKMRQQEQEIIRRTGDEPVAHGRSGRNACPWATDRCLSFLKRQRGSGGLRYHPPCAAPETSAHQ